jgi:hypothetical protein
MKRNLLGVVAILLVLGAIFAWVRPAERVETLRLNGGEQKSEYEISLTYPPRLSPGEVGQVVLRVLPMRNAPGGTEPFEARLVVPGMVINDQTQGQVIPIDGGGYFVWRLLLHDPGLIDGNLWINVGIEKKLALVRPLQIQVDGIDFLLLRVLRVVLPAAAVAALILASKSVIKSKQPITIR